MQRAESGQGRRAFFFNMTLISFGLHHTLAHSTITLRSLASSSSSWKAFAARIEPNLEPGVPLTLEEHPPSISSTLLCVRLRIGLLVLRRPAVRGRAAL